MSLKNIMTLMILVSVLPLFCDTDRSLPFDKNYIPEIHINIQKDQWDKMLYMYDKNKRYEEFVKGDLTFIQNDKETKYSNIGFRVRGNGFSRARPEHKAAGENGETQFRQAHFRISFDEYSEKQNFFGHQSINLKMFNGDPALVREIFAMDLFERYGVGTAARSWYVKLYITVTGKGENVYFGLYRINESIDKLFLKERFPKNNKGYLWKCLHPADLRYARMSQDSKAIGIENINTMEPDKSISPAYDLKTKKKDFDNAKKKLLEFALKLDELEGKDFKKWIAGAFAVDDFLRIMAVHVAVGSWDDYSNTANNYYLYFDEKGVVHYIPYDYDNILGTTFVDFDEVSVFEWEKASDKSGGRKKPLTGKIFSVPEYRDKYASYLKELFNAKKDLMDPDKSIARIKGWYAMVESHLTNDTGEYDRIIDIPASWAKKDYYRLLTGEIEGDGEINFFKQRKATILRQISRVPGENRK